MKKLLAVTFLLISLICFLASCKHSHKFGEWRIVLEAGCTEVGKMERECSCGEKETKAIEAMGHSFGEWTTVVQPTCTEDGKKERTCSCGEKGSEVIPATGHSFGKWVTVSRPTCTTNGKEERECSCGAKESRDIKYLGHNIENGLCSRCGKLIGIGLVFVSNGDGTCYVSGIGSFTGSYLIIPTHSPEGDVVTGIGSSFRDCDFIISIVIPDSVTHIYEGAFSNFSSLVLIVIPETVIHLGGSIAQGSDKLNDLYYTGSEDSWTNIAGGNSSFDDSHNIHFDYVTDENKDVEHVHSFGDWKITVAPVCTEDGEAVRYCPCGKSETTIVYSEGHTFSDWIVVTEPTCTSKGSKTRSCPCGETEYILADAKGHSYGDWINDTTPTCTEPGTKHRNCSTCGYTDRGIIDPKGHSFIDYKCSDCGEHSTSVIDGIEYVISKEYTHYVVNRLVDTEKTEIVICSTVNNLPVSEINQSVFSDCTSIVSVVIPDSVTSIGFSAFKGCTSLESIVIPFVGQSVDGSSNIHFGYIFGATSYNDNKSFVTSSLKSVVITGKSKIGYMAFLNCPSITSLVISDGVSEIADYAFDNCTSLSHIELADSIGYIGKNVFSDTAYYNDESNWENDALYIGNHLIKVNSNVSGEFNFRQGTLSIAGGAFSDCTLLTGIEIPDSIQWIGAGAFQNCSSLESITIPFVGFNGKSDNGIKVHFGYIFGFTSERGTYEYGHYSSLLRQSGNTKYYDNYTCFIPDSLTTVILTGGSTIKDSAFNNCSSLVSIVIPDGITEISWDAFSGCTSLTSIAIPDSVTIIYSDAFNFCTSLKSVYISDLTKWCSISFNDNPLRYGASLYLNGELLTEVTIPDGITAIGYRTFYGCTSLKKVTIPYGVTSIGHYAFSGCSSLESITIPNSVSEIGSYVFSDCSVIKSVIIPDSVTSIGQDMFANCRLLSSVKMSNGLSDMGYHTFYNCISLVSIEIPASIKTIDKNVFDGCYKLVEIINKSSVEIVPGTNNYAKEVHSGESKIVNQDGYLFYTFDEINYLLGYVGDETSLTLPESYNGDSYELYDYAFAYCIQLTSIEFSGCITRISNNACLKCESLVNVVISDTVESIDDYAFKNCSALESIEIPDSVTSVGKSAFEQCSLLKEIKFGIGITSISPRMFEKCTSLVSVVIPDNIVEISDYAFYECSSLKNVEIPNSIVTMGYNIFYQCPIENIVIPGEFVDRIPKANLISVVITRGEKIGGFQDCVSLVSIELPDTLTSIGYNAFMGCTALKEINIPATVTSIGENAFCGCSSLVTVELPEVLTSIGDSAFSYCTSLLSIAMPDSVTHMGSYAFSNCTSLTNVVCGNVGYRAFCRCTSLTTVVLGNSITSIGSESFYGCNSLESIVIPKSVQWIGKWAFMSCSNLKDVYYTGSEEDWKNISIDEWNSSLTSAIKHYNYTPEN